MARKPRVFVANIPYHITHRGNNKARVFLKDSDCLVFMETLQKAKARHPCLIYSYCFMPNHIHLLLEPKGKEDASRLMQLLGTKYARYFNDSYERTGTLWEGRFKSSAIDRELHFVACLRYIEMNPVKAGVVSAPELYRWSSYGVRAYGEKNPIVDLDSFYESLGGSPEERQANYRKLFQKRTTGVRPRAGGGV